MYKVLVSYDLHKPIKDYIDLIGYLKEFKNQAKPLESLWVIKSDKSQITIRDEILGIIDQDDSVLVVDVSNDAMAWHSLSPSVAEWLKNN